MDIHSETNPAARRSYAPSAISPVASERIRALALRIIEGAPALTAGETRELAQAILDHNALSDHAVR